MDENGLLKGLMDVMSLLEIVEKNLNTPLPAHKTVLWSVIEYIENAQIAKETAK